MRQWERQRREHWRRGIDTHHASRRKPLPPKVFHTFLFSHSQTTNKSSIGPDTSFSHFSPERRHVRRNSEIESRLVPRFSALPCLVRGSKNMLLTVRRFAAFFDDSNESHRSSESILLPVGHLCTARFVRTNENALPISLSELPTTYLLNDLNAPFPDCINQKTEGAG